jgi:hypothetical protein
VRRMRAANWFDSKVTQADPPRGGDAVSPAPSAEEILARLAGMEFSAGSPVTEPSLDETFPTKPIDGRSPHDQPSLGARASRRFTRFLLTMSTGVAATLAWQSYGDAAKQIVSDWVAQSGWSSWLPLAGLPSALDVASGQAARPTPAQMRIMEASRPEAALGPPPGGVPQLEAMAQDFAAIRQNVEQLAAGQEQLAHDMVKLQSAVHEIEQNTFAPAPKPNATSERKPQATAPRPRQSTVRPTTPERASRALAPVR